MRAIHGRKFIGVKVIASRHTHASSENGYYFRNPALPRERGTPPTHRRHDDLIAAADALIDLRTRTEAKVLAHADTHLAQSPAVAGHGDAVARKAGIGLHQCLLDLVGRDHQWLTGVDIGPWNLHGGAGLADGFEIGHLAQSRTGAVPVPFAEDQARRRPQ